MESRQNNRAGIPDLNVAISQQLNIGGGTRRDIMQVGTMDDAFYGQLYGGGSVVNAHFMVGGFEHQSLTTTNYDPELDQSMSMGPNNYNTVFDERP